ncbi:unnamed protein product [Arabidopsis halleri]
MLLPPDPPVLSPQLTLDPGSSSAILPPQIPSTILPPQISSAQTKVSLAIPSSATVTLVSGSSTALSPPQIPSAISPPQFSSAQTTFSLAIPSTATVPLAPVFSSALSSPQIPLVQTLISPAIPSTTASSYTERFKASLRNLRKITLPVLMEEGTPVVQAPAYVLLKTADHWKGHIVAKFHGLILPPMKIFSDLNPTWGKFGNIVIRTVGYWQAGNCAFSVYPWSADKALVMPELETALTWAVLENVPPQMYSLDGISVIASAIGEPLHTEKSRLDTYHFGNTKVNVTYPRLPPKCCNCERFGHLMNRCPKPLMKKQHGSGSKGAFLPKGTAIANTKIPLLGGSNFCTADARRKSKERSRSTRHVEDSGRHQRDELMSAMNQESVKNWIEELKDKEGNVAEKGENDRKKGNDAVVEGEITPGMRSAKKLAKLEVMLMFVRKPVKGTSSNNGDSKIQGCVPSSSSGLQTDRDSSSISLNSHSRQRFLRTWIGKNKPILGSVLETHVAEENAAQVLQASFLGWRREMNYKFANIATGDSFSVAFVYAFNNVIQRRDLWGELSLIGQNSPAKDRPFLVLGDFNKILAANEHFSMLSHSLPMAGMREFQDCLVVNDLSDISSKRAFYTWSNGRQEDPILRKLDRVLANEKWRDAFPESQAVFDPPWDSDHSLGLVILNREGFGNIQQKTKDSLEQLEVIQGALMRCPSDFLFKEEFFARKKWNFFAKDVELDGLRMCVSSLASIQRGLLGG